MEKPKSNSTKPASMSPKPGQPASSSQAPGPQAPARDGRRGFLTAAAAIVIGGIVTVFPFAAGLVVFLDPLRRPTSKAKQVKFGTLEALPDDGIPHKFPIIADLQDAWSRYPKQPVGEVFLIRQPGQNTVTAFNSSCPHAGCIVGYLEDENVFRCPCHGSTFDLQGKRVSEDEPSPRDLDSLPCNVLKNGVIAVAFQNFLTARPDKIPTA